VELFLPRWDLGRMSSRTLTLDTGSKKGTLLRKGSYRGPYTLVGRGTDILQETYIGHR
jgi:hypothetical protein